MSSTSIGFCEKCNRQDNLRQVSGVWLCTVCVRDLEKNLPEHKIKDFIKSKPEFDG